jgi:hypothetical protein
MIDILAPRLNLKTPLLPSCCKLPYQTGAVSTCWEISIPYFLLWFYDLISLN